MIWRLITYCLLLIVPISFGQELRSTISQSQFLIGEPVILSYEIKTASGDSIRFNNLQNEIPARSTAEGSSLSSDGINFEITQPFDDTTKFKGDQKTWLGEYVVTAWDSGMYLIPGPTVLINDSTFTFDEIVVAVHLVAPKDGVDLYDIRENFADIPDKPFSILEFLANNWWWLVPLVVILVIAFLIYRRNRPEPDEPEEEQQMSLKQRTIYAIEALDNAKMWEKDKLKEHFVELSYILRSYLTSRYNINLLEKTTFEAKMILTQKGLNEETVNTIARILSQSDMVKFAKSQPDIIAILRQSTLAKQIVAETSPLDFDNVD